MANTNKYEHGLDKGPANFQPLTPLGFLSRAASTFPNHTAVLHGELSYSYAELYSRCRRLASALTRRGIGTGDTVAVMAPNVPAIFEAVRGHQIANLCTAGRIGREHDRLILHTFQSRE